MELLLLGFMRFKNAELASRRACFLAVTQASPSYSTLATLPSLGHLEGHLPGIVMAKWFIGVGVVCIVLCEVSGVRLGPGLSV